MGLENIAGFLGRDRAAIGRVNRLPEGAKHYLFSENSLVVTYFSKEIEETKYTIEGLKTILGNPTGVTFMKGKNGKLEEIFGVYEELGKINGQPEPYRCIGCAPCDRDRRHAQ